MSCPSQDYLARPCEHLVLEGYRHWSCGIITGNHAHWQNAWNLYAVKLGAEEGRLALNALTQVCKNARPLRNLSVKNKPYWL